MKRRNLILLLGGTSSGAMSVGTGAFSSMGAERGVEVDVVKDSEAIVGYQSSDKRITSDETIDLVKIRNRFGDDTEIEIINVDTTVEEIEGEGPTLTEAPDFPKEPFGHWEGYQTIAGEVSCGEEPGKSRFEVTVLVRGSGVQAELFGETRSFVVECDPQTEGGPSAETLTVEFSGNGNVFVSPALNLSTEVLYSSNDGVRTEPDSGPFSWNTEKNLKNARPEDFDTGGQLVAVRFVDRGETYYNPQSDPAEIDFPEGWTEGEANPIEGESRGNGSN